MKTQYNPEQTVQSILRRTAKHNTLMKRNRQYIEERARLRTLLDGLSQQTISARAHHGHVNEMRPLSRRKSIW